MRSATASIQNICPISFGHNDLHCLPALNGATGALGNFPQCLTPHRAFVLLAGRRIRTRVWVYSGMLALTDSALLELLELLAASHDGATEALMTARGFAVGR